MRRVVEDKETQAHLHASVMRDIAMATAAVERAIKNLQVMSGTGRLVQTAHLIGAKAQIDRAYMMHKRILAHTAISGSYHGIQPTRQPA